MVLSVGLQGHLTLLLTSVPHGFHDTVDLLLLCLSTF